MHFSKKYANFVANGLVLPMLQASVNKLKNNNKTLKRIVPYKYLSYVIK